MISETYHELLRSYAIDQKEIVILIINALSLFKYIPKTSVGYN